MENKDLDRVNRIFEALGIAKAAYAMLPPLPPMIRPVHISILNAIQRTTKDGCTRVTDISRTLGFSLPNATKFINELVTLKVVKKTSSSADKRIVLVRLTKLGEQYTEEYVLSFHHRLDEAFSQLSFSDCETMIETIQSVHQAMEKVCRDRASKNEELA